jgi:8-oxo-dGTP diphosphatase
VSAVYVAAARGEPQAGDDAGATGIFDPDRLPTLAFDHARILTDYRSWRATGGVSEPPPGASA